MHSRAETLTLATDLFEKNEWELCQRECKRALLSNTNPEEQFQLLETISALNSGGKPEQAIAQFKHLISGNKNPQVSAIASYELGRLHWQLDQPEDALDSFTFTFQTTTNKDLFVHSACSLFLLFKDQKKLKKGQEDLISQINTSRTEWYGALFQQCAKPDPKKSQPSTPNWLVRFYRSQISPAIGNRCTLEPSCSEYFHQAHSKHGLKSIPMIADRFFREPEVSNNKKDPIVTESGQIRYGDPLENHDFWMKK